MATSSLTIDMVLRAGVATEPDPVVCDTRIAGHLRRPLQPGERRPRCHRHRSTRGYRNRPVRRWIRRRLRPARIGCREGTSRRDRPSCRAEGDALAGRCANAAAVLCPVDWDEPFGLVAAEAQACGTPVVAYRRGGLQDIIVDGVTGFLVEPGDIDAAAAALGRVGEIDRTGCRATRGSEPRSRRGARCPRACLPTHAHVARSRQSHG